MSEQTVIIYEDFTNPIKFFVLQGDFRRFNKVYINSSDNNEVLQDDLSSLLFNSNGEWNNPDYSEDFPVDAVKNGAHVIVAGFLP